MTSNAIDPEDRTLALLLGFSVDPGLNYPRLKTHDWRMFTLDSIEPWISGARGNSFTNKKYPTLRAALEAYPADYAQWQQNQEKR